MRKFLPYVYVLLALVSCEKHERVPIEIVEGRQPISFSAKAEKSKADFTIADVQSGGWGLYGYYSGTSNYTKPSEAQGVIFNERPVNWINNVWDYSIDATHKKEYWPMSTDEKVSFFAYAPYTMFHANAGVDADNGPYISYTASTDLAAQKDLLWGTNTSGLPHRNVNLASYPDSIVDMHFRHAPAKIHFTINGASLGDNSSDITPLPDNTTTTTDIDHSNEATGETYSISTSSNNRNRPLYYVYRKTTVTKTETSHQDIDGYKILINTVDMTNFIQQGLLYLNNPDSYVPYWAPANNNFLTYSFDTSDLTETIINPSNEATLANGWNGYLGVDSDPKELLPTPNNYIYMVPKVADNLGENTQNITITVTYHVIGLDYSVDYIKTTTTISYEVAKYCTPNNSSTRYYITKANPTNTNSHNTNINYAYWTNYAGDANRVPGTTVSESTSGDPEFNYSQDNGGLGFRAVGSINSDILGGRDYTINLYLDGRELNLTVIPQQWDLQETVYDYNTTLNRVLQSLTYDSDFVYEVVGSNVYINNRMGKFYFKLGSGMYLYWQASLIGDDAFAFTDENGEYLLDDEGNYRTAIRGNIGDDMNFIYVKAINTSSRVTSKAKLRIYLFDSENHAVVALPKNNWSFVNAVYNDNEGHEQPVQEWTVVQTAN